MSLCVCASVWRVLNFCSVCCS